MSSEMKKLRKEDISLYIYLKDRVLSDFIEREESVELEYVEELSCRYESEVYVALTTMLPSPVERGRGWVYFDDVSSNTTILDSAYSSVYSQGTLCDGASFVTVRGTRADGVVTTLGTPEQITRVTVYDALGSGIPNTEYMIDYIDGRIITSGTCSPAAVDYYFNYISLVDEWAAIEAADPPVVVIDMHGTDKTGFQLGFGKKTTRKVDIHVFASDPAERNDIVETIYDGLYLKSAPLYSFPTGGILDYDGTFFGRKGNVNKLETLFDRSRESGVIGNMLFDNVTARNISLPLLMTRNVDEVMLSDLNAYRSKISFDLVTYVNE